MRMLHGPLFCVDCAPRFRTMTIRITKLVSQVLALLSVTGLFACTSTTRSDAKDYCETWSTCDSIGFAESYESVGDCTTVLTKYGKAENYEYKVTESKECEQAYIDYTSCQVEQLTCAIFSTNYSDSYDSEAYQNWLEARDRACGALEEEYDLLCYGEEEDDDEYY